MQIQEVISIVIAFISLSVSAGTFFLTQRPPVLESYIGPIIKVYYPSDGGFAFYLPISFINYASRTGVVVRSAVIIYRKDTPQEQYFIEWDSFSTFTSDENSWTFSEVASILAIPGKSAVSKIAWFRWKPSSHPTLQIRPGEYILTFYYWTKSKGRPQVDVPHELYISNELFEELEKYRSDSKSTIVDVVLDRQIAKNRSMTLHEANKILN